ncbi:putative uncharacterized protein DDB_G0282133 isoform X2 [Agrilus planipennis]|uniref:BHLH domain-containing protein n=1 Tax=Agrilus planipennis TaxID=224129 RepID=A0A1W4WIP1_AGRPL|nr:putative uncharacterized protein DDB_G0282133 isoform X2 [Agrilus planipennis]
MNKPPNKSREWEKDRRTRINDAFTSLSKLLPCYDPSRTLSKINILKQAAAFIEELQEKINSFINNNQAKAAEYQEIKRLNERIDKLLARSDQLCNFIKDAGIKVPKVYGAIIETSSKLRWSNKISPELAKKLAKKEFQENKPNKETKSPKKKQLKPRLTTKPQKISKKFRRKLENRRLLNHKQNTPITVPLLNCSTNKNVPMGTCYLVTNPPAINLTNTDSSSKDDTSKAISKPKILPKSVSDKVLNVLGPGTLILANGTVIPILPQSQKVIQPATVLTSTNPIIVTQCPVTTTATATVVVVSTSKQETTSNTLVISTVSKINSVSNCISIGGKVLPQIRPKRCITKTTQINKVPIPALTSHYSTFNIVKQEIQKKSATISSKHSQKKGGKVVCLKKEKTQAKVSKRKCSPAETLHNTKKRIKIVENNEDIVKNKSSHENTLNNKKENSETLVENSKEISNIDNRNEQNNICEEANIVKSCIVKVNNDEQSNIGADEKQSLKIASTPCASKEIIDHNNFAPEAVENEPKINCSASQENVQADNSRTIVNRIIESNKQNITNAEKNENLKNVTEQKYENKSTENIINSESVLPSVISNLKTADDSKVQETQSVGEKIIEDPNKNNLTLGTSLYHSELSNDIFSSLQVPLGSQNQESTSPTAAFLLAFPLVSTLTGVKVTEVIDEENSDSRHGTPTLLQIGTMDSTKTSQTVPSESLTPSLLNLDNFSFFSTTCTGFYSSFDNLTYTSCQNTITYSSFSTASTVCSVAGISTTNSIKDNVEQAKNPQIEKQIQQTGQTLKAKPTCADDYITTLKTHPLDKTSSNNNGAMSINANNRIQNVNASYQPTTEKSLSNKIGPTCISSNNSFNSLNNKSLDERNSINSNGIISNTNTNNSISVCTVQTPHLSVSTSYSTTYNTFPYNNDTKCKIKNDTAAIKQTSNPISQPYSQENFNQIPYTNKDLPLSSKQHAPSVTTTVNSNVNCNFSEKKFLEQKPQINYNPNSVSSSNCNTFNPFADKQPTDCNVNYTRTYGNMLYGNNNSNYTNSYPIEGSSYYPSNKTSTSSYGQPKNSSEPYNQHKTSTDSFSNQQKTNADSYNQHKTNTDSYGQLNYNTDCKGAEICKRDSSNAHVQGTNTNYFRQSGVPHKEKINISNSSNKGAKSQPNQPQPKPPINWMTTPDLKQESTFSSTASFGKDMDYTTNNFYSSTSFPRNSHVSCFNANPPTYQAPDFQNSSVETKKSSDGTFPILSHNATQRSEFDENQFSWSPTKLPQFFETSHTFVSSTLPTLVGDLALGTIQPPTVHEQSKLPIEKDLNKNKESGRRPKQQNYDQSNNHSNFLSVSQLVEKQTDGVPSRITNRRNSGSRNNKNNISHKSTRRVQKQAENKECGDRVGRSYTQNKVEMPLGRRENVKISSQRNQSSNYVPENPTWFDYNKNQRQESNKNSQSIYSAEALLGHQVPQNNAMFRQQTSNFPSNTKSLPIPNFLSDNIMPYFSSVDLQDNNFMQQNQNFQSTALAHNFSNTVQSYTYLSNNHITSTSNISSSYLPTTSFMSELNTQDYSASAAQNNILSQSSVKIFSDKNSSKQNAGVPAPGERPAMQNIGNNDCAVSCSSVNYAKKSLKMKQSTENSLPGIVDFSFLSMPGTISSPMLPDDFHVHTNFLPPPPTPGQLYPCKNPPYSKQGTELSSTSMITLPPLTASRSQVQNIETPPNINNIGTSLTNFNLSTIFPEINKTPFQNKPPNYGVPVPHTKVNNT